MFGQFSCIKTETKTTKLDTFGAFRCVLDAFRHVSTHLDVFGRIWTGFGQVWTGFGRVWKVSGGVWRSLEEFEEVLK